MPYLIQRAIAGVALVALGPLILALAGVVRLSSKGPAFHRATRVRAGGTFTLYKLRSMRVGDGTAPSVTAAGDHRVTPIGRLLRKSKLDELPQLWNVVRGDMALVGPRPEDPRYVDWSDPLHAEVFSELPGITGPTALAYRDEETILADVAREIAQQRGRKAATDDDLDRAYREVVLPTKLRLDAEYLATRTVGGDVRVILETIGLSPRAGSHGRALAHYVEWGGEAWTELVAAGIEAMGELSGKRVLEIGARSGRMSTYFALQGAQVVGIDIEAGFAAKARSFADQSGVGDKVEFRTDDGSLTAVRGERFDIVFTKSVLVLVGDRSEYLTKIRSLLVKDGRFVAVENGRGGWIATTLRRARRTRWDPRLVDYFDKADIAELSTIFDTVVVRSRRMPPLWLFVGSVPRAVPD